jgi:hypothetical protein
MGESDVLETPFENDFSPPDEIGDKFESTLWSEINARKSL